MKRERNDGFSEEIESSVKNYKTSKKKRKDFWKYVSRVSIIGWLFVIPVVAGAYLGRYLDARYASNTSWTITLIIIGVAIGIYNVWHFLGGKGA